MTDIRCPMCGRPNPPDLEVCGFCQARLKPIVAAPSSGGEDPVQPGKKPVPRKTPDWESGLPDWLRDLRGNEDAEDETSPQEELPDWLVEKPSEAPPPERGSTSQDADWLRDLRDQNEETPLEPQDALPDWLAGDPGSKPLAQEPKREDEADWWSQRISRGSASRDEEAGEKSPGMPPVEPAGSSLPGLGQVEDRPEKVENEEDLPDWLKALSSEDFPESVAGQDEEESSWMPPATPASDEPDWLQRVRARQMMEEQPPTQAFLPEEEGDLADEKTPDWISSEASREAGKDIPSEDLPDWFSQIQETPAQDAPAPDEATPAWLAGLGAQEQDDFPWTEPAKPEAQDIPLPTEEAETMPDWLKKLEPSPSEPPTGTSVPAFVLDEETVLPFEPGQEDERKEAEAEPAAEEPALPYLSSMPEWITQVTTEGESAEEQLAEGDELGLTPAQLPTWLEAMRPVEAAAPAAPVGEEQSAQVEKVGPLAGLRGVIPAEPLIGHLRKPPAYSVKLQVSETQNRNAQLLQRLLESEGQAQAIPARTSITSQAVLRLVIAVALALAVLVPLWLDSRGQPLPDPTYVPDGVVETISLIDGLGSNIPVLLAVDYEPGLSAEMDAAASTIVNGIASRGAPFALVSTNPTGPLLSERLMSALGGSDPVLSIDYTNLGFISGGPAGLLSFANDPQGTLPYDLGSGSRPARSDVWSTGPLGDVQSVADFAMLVVITENPDTARYWIEQVQPFLQPGNVPLVMVVSAQAEPMVRPYFDAYPQQVNGLVVGLNGIATYESISGQTGPVRQYWDAFGAGLLVIEALILVGGLINIILALMMPRKGAEVEGTP